jgi:hypothetical protein
MFTPNSFRIACLAAATATVLPACGGSSEGAAGPAAPATPPPAPPGPPLPTWVAERCSIEPTQNTSPPFSEDEARKTLGTARQMAAGCQAPGAVQPGFDLIWGPSGCVRSVQLQSIPSDSTVTNCLLNAYQAAGVPPFTGSAVRLHAEPDRRHDEFSRVGILAHTEIERVVRSHQDRFRKCYLEGYKRNPGLRGTINVRFVIPESGTVTQVSSAGSTLPDQKVVSCTLQSFVGIRFPPPNGGSVQAVYPVELGPGR